MLCQKMFKLFLIISSVIIHVFSCTINENFETGSEPCAYKACHKVDPNKINIHLIPHSHDDVGWLKNPEEYFYGTKNYIARANVQSIIGTTLQALKRNSDRRYIQVETAFFWKWWQEQTEENRLDFRKLVQNGQIEMIGGGWSMNDEACTNYQSIINQFSWGLRLLNDTLGECGKPRIGWQIDPFGHSREQASIFKQMGFVANFFIRLSNDERNIRRQTKNSEFWWETSNSLDSNKIFTSIFPTPIYYEPKGFCFDVHCSDSIIDDPNSTRYNVPSKVSLFSKYSETYAEYFKTNHVLIPMGGDFQYESAEVNFGNTDKLIKAFKNNEKYNVIYSTPSCYYKAVQDFASQNDVHFETRTGDFFPYYETNHTYWTGYFTSKATAKRFERTGNNILQAAEQLNAFAKMRDTSKIDYEQNVIPLREAMGTLQHHDAITGTAREAVAKYYALTLHEAIVKAEKPIGKILGNLLKKEESKDDVTLPLSTCLLANISVCEASIKDKFLVAVYNPLSKPVTHYVRLPCQAESNYKITGPDGNEDYDILPVLEYPHKTIVKSNEKEIIFAARNIPALGSKVYYVEKTGTTNNIKKIETGTKYGTEKVSFTLNSNNVLASVTMNNKTLNISQTFMAYLSHNGSRNGVVSNSITSGAYVFRPLSGTSAYHIDYFKEGQSNSTKQNATLISDVRGKVVDQVTQQFNDWLQQTIRVYKGEDNNYVEFDWMVGPLSNDVIDMNKRHGKEIISRFFVENFKNDYFYTDSNGREMLQRQRNGDPYGNPNLEPVASNYYPVTSKLSILDEQQQLQVSVLTDRSQGGSSLWNGEIELMVHRRTLKDDFKGVEEPLQETEHGKYIVVRGQHYLTFGSTDTLDKNRRSIYYQERDLALKKLLQPWVLVGDATAPEWSLENLKNKINLEWSGLGFVVPDNINLLSLHPWKDDHYLLRLENILEKDEYSKDSGETSLSLKELFTPHYLVSGWETYLAGNEIKPSEQPLQDNDFMVTLKPMEIKTFIVKIKI